MDNNSSNINMGSHRRVSLVPVVSSLPTLPSTFESWKNSGHFPYGNMQMACPPTSFSSWTTPLFQQCQYPYQSSPYRYNNNECLALVPRNPTPTITRSQHYPQNPYNHYSFPYYGHNHNLLSSPSVQYNHTPAVVCHHLNPDNTSSSSSPSSSSSLNQNKSGSTSTAKRQRPGRTVTVTRARRVEDARNTVAMETDSQSLSFRRKTSKKKVTFNPDVEIRVFSNDENKEVQEIIIDISSIKEEQTSRVVPSTSVSRLSSVQLPLDLQDDDDDDDDEVHIESVTNFKGNSKTILRRPQRNNASSSASCDTRADLASKSQPTLPTRNNEENQDGDCNEVPIRVKRNLFKTTASYSSKSSREVLKGIRKLKIEKSWSED